MHIFVDQKYVSGTQAYMSGPPKKQDLIPAWLSFPYDPAGQHGP